MDYSQQLEQFFGHLFRLALDGTDQEVLALGRRVARSARNHSPEFSQKLIELISSSPSGATKAALRKSSMAVVPVDKESRLDLVSIENLVVVDQPPVLDQSIASIVDQIILEHSRAEELSQHDLEPANTILFEGPPGVGKTLTAKWIASRLSKPLMTLSLSSVMSSLLGRTGNNLNAVISYAKESNGILLLDEFDAIAKKRDDSSEVGELKRLVTVLLQEIDNWPKGNILIAATNHSNLLDLAVWRRFNVVCHFANPHYEQLDVYLRGLLNGQADDHIVEALKITLKDQSYSHVKRFITRCQKASILYEKPLRETIFANVASELVDKSKSEAKKVATELLNAGFSQRQISDLTGLARDTIRKFDFSEIRNG